MNIQEFAKSIIFGESLDDKLQPVCESIRKSLDDNYRGNFEVPRLPSRNQKIEFSSKNLKFPKLGRLHEDEQKARALHFFANHELLAIEMMACALLLYPHETKEQRKFKLGLLQTIKDEQKHFKLYKDRMKDFGLEFGDLGVNGFFWSKMKDLKTPEQYLAVMSLTFEAANLDFASFYRDFFFSVEDEKTANVLDIVYEDEITHVAYGAHWLNVWRGDQPLWDYYYSLIPLPLTPARAKGQKFDELGRIRSGLGENFTEKMKSYQDDFQVTQRKQWT